MNDLLKKVSLASLMFVTVFTMSFGSFVPKVSAALAAGDLVKGPSSDAVYYISGTMKHVFPDKKTYMTWYSNFDAVKKVTVAELDMYPTGAPVAYRPGTKLVTHPNTAKVYAVEPGGVLRWIPSETVAKNLFGNDWAKRVYDVHELTFGNYTVGSDLGAMYPKGSLLKKSTEATVYYYDGTSLRSFSTGAFDANKLDAANVVTADLSAYTMGTAITGAESMFTIAGAGTGTNVPSGPVGALTVALAPTTPASSSVLSDTAEGGQQYVGTVDVNFSASTAGEVKVTKLTYNRIGISSDTDLENIYLFDGWNKLAEGSISNGVVTFNAPNGLFTVAAGATKNVSLRVNVAENLGGGKTFGFALASITSNATSQVGTLPITGNLMSTVSVTDGGWLKIAGNYANPTGTDTAVNPDQTAFEVWNLSVQSQDQPMSIKRLVFTEVGSISVGDLTNFELYAAGTKVGTAEMGTDYTVAFDLSANPITLAKGSSKELSLRANIVKGSTRTFYFSFQYPTDVLAMDTNYNTYAPVDLAAPDGWSVIKSTGNYKIASGTLTVSKANDSRTDSVAIDSTSISFGKFLFKAAGEDIKIKDLTASSTTTGDGNLDNGAIYVDGVQVGSTKDIVRNTGTQFTFGSSFIIPAGTTKTVEIVADAKKADGTSYTNGNSVKVGFAVGADNAQGVTSLTAIDAPAAITDANSLTFTDASLVAAKYTGYGDQTIVAGTTNARMGSFVLTAGSSSAVSVSSITVALSSDEAASVTNLWLKNRATNEMYGVAKAAPTTSNLFSGTVNVPASGAVVYDIYADVIASASVGPWIASVSATGTANSGSTSVSATAAPIQTITLGSGQLSVTTGSNPDSDVLLADTTGNEVAKFQFSAANDSFTVQELAFKVSNSLATSTAAITISYPTQTGTETKTGIFVASGNNDYATTTFTGMALYVPKGGDAVVTAKIDFTSIASGAASGANGVVKMAYNSGFKAVGGSGVVSTSVGSSDLSSNTFYLRKSKPTFAKIAPGVTSPVTGDPVFKFTVVSDAKGSIDIKQLGFLVTTSGATLSAMKLYNSATGLAVSDTAAEADVNGHVKLIVGLGTGVGDDDVLTIDTSSKTYDVRGTVTSFATTGDEISVKFDEDSAASQNGVAATLMTSYKNVWSDRSANAHTTATSDWTNGYLLKQMTGTQTFTKT